jgi:haloalkane dehalogenase
MHTEQVIDDFLYQPHYVTVRGAKIHYIEQGEGGGHPVLFLHGIPAWSYLWRNVIPFVSPLARCIAPDLPGFGKSDKPDIEYTIEDHIQYIESFIESLNLKNIILVLHGWGSIVGFHYAMRHESNCKGLVFYESYLRPLNGAGHSLPYQEQLIHLEKCKEKHDIMGDAIPLVDTILAQAALHKFTEKELQYYRQPFLEKGSGKSLYQHLREVSHTADAKMNQLILDYSQRLTQSILPKLLLYSVPGFITLMSTVAWAKENLPALEVGDLGEELHYAPEFNPRRMGEMISVWLQGVERVP